MLRWVYEKDAANIGGSDRARLDNINFPPFNLVTGIYPALVLGNGISVYPNPATGMSVIQFVLSQPDVVSLDVFNALGEKVCSPLNNIRLGEGVHKSALSAANLEKGIYFIRLTAGNKVQTSKFIVE